MRGVPSFCYGLLVVGIAAGCGRLGFSTSRTDVDAARADGNQGDGAPLVVDASLVGLDAPTDAPVAELGRISYWAGKVNIHRPFGGAWAWDPDCSSGSTIAVLTYCKKWFPMTTTVTQVTLTQKTTPLLQDAGCAAVYVYDGQEEYTCNQ